MRTKIVEIYYGWNTEGYKGWDTILVEVEACEGPTLTDPEEVERNLALTRFRELADKNPGRIPDLVFYGVLTVWEGT